MTDVDVRSRPAADLSEEEWDRRVERCQELQEQIDTGIAAGRVAWWSTASALYGSTSGMARRCWATSRWRTGVRIERTIAYSTYRQMCQAWAFALTYGKTLEDLVDVPPSNLVVAIGAVRRGELRPALRLSGSPALSKAHAQAKYQPRRGAQRGF